MLNPLTYSLRNKDVKVTLRKTLERKIFEKVVYGEGDTMLC